MPTLKRFGKWQVKVYGPGDHNPPHFHIVGPDEDMLVDAASLRVIKGDSRAVPPEVMEWARDNRDAIVAMFQALNGLRG